MDPALTLRLFLSSLQDRDTESARSYAEYLCSWIDKGGFTPKAVASALAALDGEA